MRTIGEEASLVESGLEEASEAQVATDVIEAAAKTLAARSPLIARIVDAFKAWNERVKSATRNILDLKFLIVLPFALHSLFFRQKDPFFWILLGLFAVHAIVNLTTLRPATAPA